MAEASKPRVFISYSRRDVAFVDRLEEGLKAAGFETVVDRHAIDDLEAWQTRLEQLIVSADIVVFVLSPDSVGSRHCGWEVAQARKLNKRLAPILLRSVEEADVPADLAELQFVFFNAPAGFDAAMQRLARALSGVPQWERQHTELLQQAWRWANRGQPRALLLGGAALVAAERWLADRPEGTTPPAALHVSYIAASRVAVRRRRRILTAALVLVAALVAQAAFVFLALGLDSRINTIRLALRSGRLEEAWTGFRALGGGPARWAPKTASMNALATDLLNTGRLTGLARFDRVADRKPDWAVTGEAMAAGGSVFLLERSEETTLLARCVASGPCVHAALNGWTAPQLVRDGDAGFLIALDQDRGTLRIAPLPDTGELTLAPEEKPVASEPRLVKVEAGWLWRADGFLAPVGDTYGAVFSTAPATLYEPQPALADLPSLPEAMRKALDDASLNPDGAVVCGEKRPVCAGRVIDLAADARGTVGQIELWTRARPEDGGPEAWTRAVSGLFRPPPSRNVIAVSPDGRLLAVSENAMLHIWRTDAFLSAPDEGVPRTDTGPVASFRLSDTPVAMGFTNAFDLAILTRSSLLRLDTAPRAVAFEPPAAPPASAPAAEPGEESDTPDPTPFIEGDASRGFTLRPATGAPVPLAIPSRSLADLLARSLQGGAVSVFGGGNGLYLVVLPRGLCPAPEGDTDHGDPAAEFVANLLVVSAEKGAARPALFMPCVDPFPWNADGYLSTIGVFDGLPGRLLFGSYRTPGIFDWDAGKKALTFYHFDTAPDGVRLGKASRHDIAVVDEDGVPTAAVPRAEEAGIVAATVLDVSEKAGLVAFFKAASSSGSTDSYANVLDLDGLTIRRLDNRNLAYFDNLWRVELSPSGTLLLTGKYDTGLELFRPRTGERIPLPPAATDARFVSDTALDLTDPDGATIRWAVPEGDDSAFSFLARSLQAP